MVNLWAFSNRYMYAELRNINYACQLVCRTTYLPTYMFHATMFNLGLKQNSWNFFIDVVTRGCEAPRPGHNILHEKLYCIQHGQLSLIQNSIASLVQGQ